MQIVRLRLVLVLAVTCVSCGRTVGSDLDAAGEPDAAGSVDAASSEDARTLMTSPEFVGAWFDHEIGSCIDEET